MNNLPVIIIGAGPVGLAAAAHLSTRNERFLLFEAGPSAGANVLSWGHVRIFSPWRYNIDKAARALLLQYSWQPPNDAHTPTGNELVKEYLKPLADLPNLRDHIVYNSRVLSVGRKNLDKVKTHGRFNTPFAVQVLHDGNKVKVYDAKAVIDSSGTWQSPNPIGSGGTYATGELEHADRIFYGIPDVLGEQALRYQNKHVLIVGSGHSSINTILGLAALKEKFPATTIHWVLRKNNMKAVYGGQEKDALEARGALGIKIEKLVKDEVINIYAPFQIQQIASLNGKLIVAGHQDNTLKVLPMVDEIISNTGSRPDFSFLREVRLSIDSSLESVSEIAELIDPNIHSCGTVRPHGEQALRHAEKDFYIVGSKSYGRAPTFLMATGYEQVRSIVAAIHGDMEAARNVELDLPETGVCSTDLGDDACCGSAKPETTTKKLAALNASCC